MIRHQKTYRREWDIGENIYGVRFVRFQDEDLEKTGLVYGMTDPSEHLIYLTLGQTARERFKSFVHEVFEAMSEEYPEVKKHLTHKAIEALEEPVARFFEDNGLIW